MTSENSPSPTWRQRWQSSHVCEWVQQLVCPGDTTHELALGASIGVFVAFTPLLGLHLFIIVFVAFIFQRLIRFNKAMAIAVCYVNNPLTFAPMLWASYEVGARLVPSAATKLNARELPLAFDWHGGIQSIPSYLVGIGLPMLIGCLVLGGVLAALTYPVTYALVRWYRRGESSQLPDSTFESVDSPRTSNSQAQ